MTHEQSPDPTPPRRRRRKEARPAEIVEAAFRAFAERGYADSRIEDIAARAGVAKGTVYLYFPDKEALFEAVARSRLQPLVGMVAELASQSQGTTREILRTLIERMHAAVPGSDLEVLIRIILSEGRRFPELVDAYHRESISHATRLLGAVMERGIERGEVRRGAVADLPLVLVAPVIMEVVWRMTFDRCQPVRPTAWLAAHLELVLDGVLLR